MVKMSVIFYCILTMIGFAWAAPLEGIKNRDPSDSYLLGVGTVQSSGDLNKDKRTTEILARLEIAKTIKVTIREDTVDILCEQRGKTSYDSKSECVSQVSSRIEESVDVVLEGSIIVEAGEDKTKGTYYSVAVLPRKQTAIKAEQASREAREKVREYIDNAKTAKDETVKYEEIQNVKEELKKSLAYDGEKAVIENVKQNADKRFTELADEISKLEKARSA